MGVLEVKAALHTQINGAEEVERLDILGMAVEEDLLALAVAVSARLVQVAAVVVAAAASKIKVVLAAAVAVLVSWVKELTVPVERMVRPLEEVVVAEVKG